MTLWLGRVGKKVSSSVSIAYVASNDNNDGDTDDDHNIVNIKMSLQ